MGSPDFYDLQTGDIIWVYTGVLERERLRFHKIEGDSLFTDVHPFHIGSITRIQKEYASIANTGILAGGAATIAVAVALSLMVTAFVLYIKLATLI